MESTPVRTNERKKLSERLLVRTEPEELAAWKEQAAVEGKLLSEWVRETLNGVLDGIESAPVKVAVSRVKKPVEKPKKEVVHQKCRHGLFYCATCLELACAES